MTLAGCTVDALASEACGGLLAWALGEPAPQHEDELRWLLAHGDDGITWGFRDVGGTWQLASTRFPEIAPAIAAETLSTLRLFGPTQEVLMWRTDGTLEGRRVTDGGDVAEDWLRPKSEQRVVLGDRLLERRDGFARVGSPTGAELVVPLDLPDDCFRGGRWPLRLEVRHYFQALADSGAVRIAMTRLVDMKEHL